MHKPNLEMLRGNNKYNPLKISRFGNTWTVSESGEFEWDCKTGIGQIKRDSYLNI